MSTVKVVRVLWHYAFGDTAGVRHERIGQQVDNVGVAAVVDTSGSERPDMAGVELALTGNGRIPPIGWVRAIDSISNAGTAFLPAGSRGQLYQWRIMYRYLSNGRPTSGADLFTDDVVCGYVLEPVTGIAHADPAAVEAALTQSGRVPPAGFSRVIENVAYSGACSVLVA